MLGSLHGCSAASVATLGFSWLALASADECQLPSAKTVPDLIRTLGSARFAEREKAMRELAARDDALSSVRRATGSDDAEIRRRAKIALNMMGGRITERYVASARQGRVDLLTEWLACCDQGVDQ